MLQFRTKSHEIIFSDLRCKSSIRIFFFASKNTTSHIRSSRLYSQLYCFFLFLSLLPHHTLNSTRSQTPINGQIPSFPPEKRFSPKIANLRGTLADVIVCHFGNSFLQSCFSSVRSQILRKFDSPSARTPATRITVN